MRACIKIRSKFGGFLERSLRVWYTFTLRWCASTARCNVFFLFAAQGIIHRDLKPVNLFLDSLGRIKIGDIGLATTHGTTRGGMSTESTDSIANGQPLKMNSSTKESMTGKVGTTLYVAPELGKWSGGRMNYSQKVDLYSLGIIVFKMCYKPLTTSMERVKVLVNQRTVSACLPALQSHKNGRKW